MTLPTISTPIFEIDVKSLNKKVKFRPFLVREEKILILAGETEEVADMVNAMRQVIKSCAKEDLDVESLPYFDLQNIFIRLREQSIGSVTDFVLICGECSHRTNTQLDLNQIQITEKEGHNNNIKLDDNVGVIMKYPRLDSMVQTEKPVYDLVVECIEKIYTDEEIFNASEYSADELNAFVDSLSNKQFEKIVEFFETAPKIQHVIEYNCANCGTKNYVVVDGVQNFFG